jgi:DNA-binding HxlR family transcriptional regulator
MSKRKSAPRRSDCPVNASLEVFGDRWTLLVVRDLMFGGRCSYRDFLKADEKIATNILAERLHRLEANGIVEKRRDPEDGRKINYRLTEKGIDLAPVLVEMIVWAAHHEDADAPPAAIHEMTANRDAFITGLRERWRNGR